MHNGITKSKLNSGGLFIHYVGISKQVIAGAAQYGDNQSCQILGKDFLIHTHKALFFLTTIRFTFENALKVVLILATINRIVSFILVEVLQFSAYGTHNSESSSSKIWGLSVCMQFASVCHRILLLLVIGILFMPESFHFSISILQIHIYHSTLCIKIGRS